MTPTLEKVVRTVLAGTITFSMTCLTGSCVPGVYDCRTVGPGRKQVCRQEICLEEKKDYTAKDHYFDLQTCQRVSGCRGSDGHRVEKGERYLKKMPVLEVRKVCDSYRVIEVERFRD